MLDCLIKGAMVLDGTGSPARRADIGIREGRIAASVTGYLPGEVLLDAALAKAGVKVPAEIVARADTDLRKREAMR